MITNRNQLALRKEAHSLIAYHMHHSDNSTIDTFHRLIHKCSKFCIKGRFLKFSEAIFTTDELVAMRQPGDHTETSASRMFEPPILFKAKVGDGKQHKYYILDGQKRINRWSEQAIEGPHRCIIARQITRRPEQTEGE